MSLLAAGQAAKRRRPALAPACQSAYGRRVRYRFDEIELDVPRRELLVRGVARQVQPQVFDLLSLLVRERGRVLSKSELLERLWPDAVVSESSIQRSISLARSALGESGERIRTYARRGYAFVEEVATDEEAIAAPVVTPPALEVRYANSDGVHIAYSTQGQGPVDVALILGWAMPFEALGWHPRLTAFRDAYISMTLTAMAVVSGCGDDAEQGGGYCQTYCEKHVECRQAWMATGEPSHSLGECLSLCTEERRESTDPPACRECIQLPCNDYVDCLFGCG